MIIPREVLALAFQDATEEGLQCIKSTLESMALGKPLSQEYGICFSLGEATLHLKGCYYSPLVVGILSPYWPQYSGDPEYPIPGGVDAYLTFPRWEGEQLIHRKSLSLFLLNALEEYLKSP